MDRQMIFLYIIIALLAGYLIGRDFRMDRQALRDAINAASTSAETLATAVNDADARVKALPTTSDPNDYTDEVNAVNTLKAALDGATNVANGIAPKQG